MPQCQFMFFVVFGFRKVLQEIFSERDRTKAKVPNMSKGRQSPKGSRREATGWPDMPWARAHLWPRLGIVWAPLAASDSALRLYNLCGKTLGESSYIHEKF